MSGYECPICRPCFKDRPRIKWKPQVRLLHLQNEHNDIGMCTDGKIHCPISGCGFICDDLDDFELHCAWRHYDSGAFKCNFCPPKALPFTSEIDLVRHEHIAHSHNRFKNAPSRKSLYGKRQRDAEADLQWTSMRVDMPCSISKETTKKLRWK